MCEFNHGLPWRSRQPVLQPRGLGRTLLDNFPTGLGVHFRELSGWDMLALKAAIDFVSGMMDDRTTDLPRERLCWRNA